MRRLITNAPIKQLEATERVRLVEFQFLPRQA
jgi:hypothetical protein